MNKWYQRKTAKNRGNSRIWLEGKILAENGFQRGDMLEKSFQTQFIENGTLVFRRESNPISEKRYHRIAGTVNRPILDCCGKWVTEFMDGAERYSVEINPVDKVILIQPMRGE